MRQARFRRTAPGEAGMVRRVGGESNGRPRRGPARRKNGAVDAVWILYSIGGMRHLNVRLTPAFDVELRELMRRRGLRSKSAAIRLAVAEALDRTVDTTAPDFTSWIGVARHAPVNPSPRFASATDDDLWR